MNEQDKQLLLKDLCGRLPYGFMYQVIYDDRTPQTPEKVIIDGEFTLFDGWQIHEIKPYLRPLSSMTEKEGKEYDKLSYVKKINYIWPYEVPGIIRWLNIHHFDYRSLIKKGLALKAPEGMYKVE